MLLKISPEKYKISAYITLFIQIGNLAAFLCVTIFIIMKLKKFKYPIIIFLILSLITSVLIGYLKNITVTIGGIKRSLALYVLCFVSGGIASSLSITIFPFSSKYGLQHIIATSTGSGSSGLIISILAAIQQPSSKNPHISFEAFFWIAFSFIALSTISFFVIIKMEYLKKINTIKDITKTNLISYDDDLTQITTKQVVASSEEILSKIKYYACNQLIISIMYYIIMSSLTFTVRSLDDRANKFLFFTTIFGLSMGSIGRLLTMKWRVIRVLFLSIIQVGPFVFLLSMCFLKGSDTPIFFGWMVVLFFSIQNLLYGIEETSNYQNISIIFNNVNDIEKGTRYLAISNQIGAFAGSIIGFLLSLYAF